MRGRETKGAEMTAFGPGAPRSVLGCCLALVLLWTTTAQAVRLSAGTGLLSLGIVDELASPLRYEGNAVPVRVALEWDAPSETFAVDGAFSRQRLESTITEGDVHYEKDTRLELRAAYLPGTSAQLAGWLRVRPLVGSRVSLAYREHYYFRAGREQFFDCLVSLVEVGGRLEYDLPGGLRHSLIQDLSLPVVGLHVRTPYSGLTRVPDAGFAWPNDFLHVVHSLTYRCRVWRGVFAEATYVAAWWRIDEPRRQTGLRQSAVLGVGVEL